MRIAQLAPTYERVPPVTYGGTELIVHLLTEALVARGHEVTLFATGDSITSARLHAVAPRPYRYGDPSDVRHAEVIQLANVQAAFRAAADGAFDLVHNHAGFEGLALAASSSTPVLTTCHLDWMPEAATIWDAYPWFHHQVSAAQAARFPARGRLAPVHHGIRVEDIEPRLDRPGDGDLLFLGRYTPAKGPERAIAAARAAGRRLILAGKVDAADESWFRREVAPGIDGDRVIDVGEVDGATKARLFADAAALLFPISWDEPFGLVIVEALAAGTPVVGFGRGSVPELIDDGATGFIVADVAGMGRAIDRLGDIDRARCRRAAEERFGVDRMVDEILARYASVLDGGAAEGAAAGLAIAG